MTSKTVQRQARIEWELNHVVLDAVFKARETSQLQAVLSHEVYENKDFQKLPKYRQIALEAYFRGVVDATAKVAGVHAPAISIERPKTVPPIGPKRGRGRPRKTPSLYPSAGLVLPLPDWVAAQTIPVA